MYQHDLTFFLQSCFAVLFIFSIFAIPKNLLHYIRGLRVEIINYMDNLTLSITTIGDLLLKSRITRKKDGKPIENVRFTIPDYQRPYKWTARNAIQLLDDIIEAKNNNKEVYRVGTLILHKETDAQGDVIYNIVDGQQRTLTFSLLLFALYENTEDICKIKFLEQHVFDNSYTRHNIPNNLKSSINPNTIIILFKKFMW